MGLGKKSYEYENDLINDHDRAYGTICMDFWRSPSLRYLNDFAQSPKDLQTKIDRTFGKHNEDIYSNLESTFRTTRVPYSKVLAFTLFDEVVQDEEEAESSTQSIRIEESLLGVTPSPATLEVQELFDKSSPHMNDPE